MTSDNIITKIQNSEEKTNCSEEIQIDTDINDLTQVKEILEETQINDLNATLIESTLKEEKKQKKIEIEDSVQKVEETLKLETEIKEEEKEIEEKTEPKEIKISIDNCMLVESGIEIKYTSLQLNNFPISYSNFSKDLSFNEIISVGTTSVKIGNYLLNNASIKILVYDKFKLLEIKTREFKVALSIDLINKEHLVKAQDYYKYEIFNKIKTSRFIEVINIFKEIFKGTKLEFQYKKLIGEISFENRIEIYKFNVLEEIVNSYKNIVTELSLNREKNIIETTNNFYEIFLTECSLKNKKFDSWINFRIRNSYDIQKDDKIIFERIHHLNFKGINFDIKEIIKIKDGISQREITQDNEICSYRKAVEISLEKIEKNS